MYWAGTSASEIQFSGPPEIQFSASAPRELSPGGGGRIRRRRSDPGEAGGRVRRRSGAEKIGTFKTWRWSEFPFPKKGSLVHQFSAAQ